MISSCSTLRTCTRLDVCAPASPAAGLPASDADAAARAALDHINLTAANAVSALKRKGVFPE
ncbi:hypothetical protein GCM10009558_083920 [Virgisporangium aurantiacum]